MLLIYVIIPTIPLLLLILVASGTCCFQMLSRRWDTTTPSSPISSSSSSSSWCWWWCRFYCVCAVLTQWLWRVKHSDVLLTGTDLQQLLALSLSVWESVSGIGSGVSNLLSPDFSSQTHHSLCMFTIIRSTSLFGLFCSPWLRQGLSLNGTLLVLSCRCADCCLYPNTESESSTVSFLTLSSLHQEF